jgi:hypothetical protein
MPINPDQLLQLFQPGGPVDVWGRLLTPGVKSVTPSPQDDPFYARHINAAINPAPATPQMPGTGYAQQMAGHFGDTGTAASTVGVKEQKAQKIKKVKK